MYQFIVLSLGILLVFGGGYLIEHVDKQDVIVQAAHSDPSRTFDYLGTFICDTDSRCNDPRTLNISGDHTFSLTISYDNGVETEVDSGMWKRDGRGVTLTVTTTSTSTLEKPYSISLYAPSGDALITHGKVETPNWGTPIFRKQIENSDN